MKVAVVCQSLLLSKALQSFLGELIVPYKQCDFVISDKKIELDKPIFHISTLEGELLIPFSKSTLLLELERFHTSLSYPNSEVMALPISEVLEDKIAALTERFRQELIQTLRDYYGN